MLIEAEALDPKSGRDREPRYKFSEGEKRSRIPVWIALALSGAFAYFKIFSAAPDAHAAALADAGRPAPDHHLGHKVQPTPPAAPDLGNEPSSDAPQAWQPPSNWYEDSVTSTNEVVMFDWANADSQSIFRKVFVSPHFVAHGNDNWIRSNDPGGAPHRAAHLFQAPGAEGAPAAESKGLGQSPSTPRSQEGDKNEGDRKNNSSPVVTGSVRLRDLTAGQTMLLTLGDLLLGARDANGDPLHVSNLGASNGQVIPVGEDSWVYVNSAPGAGPVTLSYDISDGAAEVHQTASFSILLEAVPLVVSDNEAAKDFGSAPSPASPTVVARLATLGEESPSEADQGPAADGSETLIGSAGDDIIRGGGGDDIIKGGDGDDHLYGGDGADSVFGGAGNDTLDGGNGNDTLDAGGGNDSVLGGTGSDILDGGDGSDSVSGDDGDDRIADGAGDDRIDGGQGEDTLDLSASALGVVVDLGAGVASGPDIGSNTITSIERVIGGGENDKFVIGEDAVRIIGGAGDDLYDLAPVPAVAPAPDETASAGALRYLEVMDFSVGDRLKIGIYDVWEQPASTPRLRFDDIYAGADPDTGPPIRSRDDHLDDLDVTIVEADLDQNGAYEIFVSLSGHHHVSIASHPIA